MVEAGTNVATFDVWTIPHGAIGFLAGHNGVGLVPALWAALALEAVEIGLSGQWPDLARETRSNQLGDIAAFLAGYMVGTR